VYDSKGKEHWYRFEPNAYELTRMVKMFMRGSIPKDKMKER
jgi:hypothetical protein